MRAHQVTFPFATRLFLLTIEPTRSRISHLQKLHTLSHTKRVLFSEISRAVKLRPISLLANKHRPLKPFLIIGDNARKRPWEDSHARGQWFESISGHQLFCFPQTEPSLHFTTQSSTTQTTCQTLCADRDARAVAGISPRLDLIAGWDGGSYCRMGWPPPRLWSAVLS